MFAGSVQFEHAFRFVTKAYDVIVSTTCKFHDSATCVGPAPYRKRYVRAIMTTACDHACRLELHRQAWAPSPSAKS